VGIHGWYGIQFTQRVPHKYKGVFHAWTSAPGGKNEVVNLPDIADGTSNTAFFSERKRGSRGTSATTPSDPNTDITLVADTTWDKANWATNANNLTPLLPNCDTPTKVIAYGGLQYYRGFYGNTLYTHTIPPNYSGRDCMRDTGFNVAHLAARSYHDLGVNVAMGDGGVRFIRNAININVWKAIGTRMGGETNVSTD
jgi:hypothetical protein